MTVTSIFIPSYWLPWLLVVLITLYFINLCGANLEVLIACGEEQKNMSHSVFQGIIKVLLSPAEVSPDSHRQ